MKNAIILVSLVLLAGCGLKMQTYSVADVTKSSTITLTKFSSQGSIHSMTVIGTGHIDGVAEVALNLNGKAYKTEKLSGDISFRWGGDWYFGSAQLEYTPSSVKSGNFILKYKFEDI